MIDCKNTQNDLGKAAESASKSFDSLGEQIEQAMKRGHTEKVLREIRNRRRSRCEVVE